MGLTANVVGKKADVTSPQLCTTDIIAFKQRLYILHASSVTSYRKYNKSCAVETALNGSFFLSITQYHKVFLNYMPHKFHMYQL
jgi:hypothetical protein